MDRKLKYALAALLGFSAACSSVKNSPSKGSDPKSGSEVAQGDSLLRPRIIAMYGVRTPERDSIRRARFPQAEIPDTLAPVYEEPREDISAVDSVRK